MPGRRRKTRTTRLLASVCMASLAVVVSIAQETAPTSPFAAQPSVLAAQVLPRSPEYAALQGRLAQGWNTWDARSVAAHVLLPQGLAIRIGMKHNTTESNAAFLRDALIVRLEPGAEQVTPGPHAWDGSYTDLRVSWKGHEWRCSTGIRSLRQPWPRSVIATWPTPMRSKHSAAQSQLAAKSYELFLKEWSEHGHVHENYNAVLGTGDDISNSDRFYHWGALLGYMEYLQETTRPSW